MDHRAEETDRSWTASPCSTCSSSPCCTRLPLHRFHVEGIADFDRIERALAVPRVEVGLYESGWWMIYYLTPCRFLNPLDSRCMIHGSDRQPQICKEYSPQHCWYKRVFADGVSPDFLRFNRERFRLLRSHVRFDAAGELSAVPSWEAIEALITPTPLDSAPAGATPIERVAPPTRPAAADPGLCVPLRRPRTRGDLQMLRFRLGFHGMRVGIHGDEWVLIVGTPREAGGFDLLSYEGLDALLPQVRYDERGSIIGGFEFPGAPRPGTLVTE